MKPKIERIRQKLLLWKSEYITQETERRIKRIIWILIFAIIIKFLEIARIFERID